MNRKPLVQFGSLLMIAMVMSSCAPSVSTVKVEGESIDPVMGDWAGHRVMSDGMVVPMAVQSIALGGNKYRFNMHRYFDRRDDGPVTSFEGQVEGGRIVDPENPAMQATISGGRISGHSAGKIPSFEFAHVVRLSPALGAKPPAGAVVIFDGTNLNAWERRDEKQRSTPVNWKLVGGAMEVTPGGGDIVTKQKFTNFQLHVEFRSPFMPEARGQARGNSGVYLQGRYEVQVLDSYGLAGEDNECGGIYKVSKPRVNMCAPPGQWQSYDVTFHAPQFDAEGKKVKDAVVTVVHNGIVIHENLVIPGPTGGAIDGNVQLPAGLLLQDHGNLVQFRNIWLVELKN
jgi:hypothetical protein